MTTAVVILAAGASSRMGAPKQLLRVGGERLLERAVRAAHESSLGPVVLVLGANAEQIQRECELCGVHVILHAAWAEGLSSSLRKGIAEADALGVDAAVVMTADMPFVNGDHLRALAVRSKELGKDAASWYDGLFGIPACFRRSSFADIAQLRGDKGARALLLEAPVVELRNGADVDTPEALQQANRIADDQDASERTNSSSRLAPTAER